MICGELKLPPVIWGSEKMKKLKTNIIIFITYLYEIFKDSGIIITVNGLSGVILSLIMWKLTESYLGWLILFIPGSILTIFGTILIFLKY
jgi:hypothetical protein